MSTLDENDLAGDYSITMDIYNGKQNISLDNTQALIRKIHNSNKFSDITIIFKKSDVKIPAHKLILSMTSKKLADMCITADKELFLEENPEIFSWLIEHAYTGHLNFCYPLPYLIELYYLLDRYSLSSVCTTLAENIAQRMNASNLQNFYSSKLANIVYFKKLIQSIIATSGVRMLETASDGYFPDDLVRDILKIDEFRCHGTELGLLKSLIEWAKTKIPDDVTKDRNFYLRAILKPFLKYIRFHTMSPEMLISEVEPLKVFEESDICTLMRRNVGDSSWNVPVTADDDENNLELPKKRKFYCRPWEADNITIIRKCNSGDLIKDKKKWLLLTIQASETIQLYTIFLNVMCFKGPKTAEVYDDQGICVGYSTAIPFEFVPALTLHKERTYKVVLKGQGSSAKHEFQIFSTLYQNVEISGEALSCSISIKVNM